MTKTEWNAFYRRLRIVRREAQKAALDLLVFGTGAIFLGNNGMVKHIPLGGEK